MPSDDSDETVVSASRAYLFEFLPLLFPSFNCEAGSTVFICSDETDDSVFF